MGAVTKRKEVEEKEKKTELVPEKESNNTQEEKVEEKKMEEKKEDAGTLVTPMRQDSWGRVGGTALPLRADESKLPILPAPIIPPIPPQFMLPAQPFDNNMHHFQQQMPQNQLPWHWGPDSGAGKGSMMWGDMRSWGNNSQATIKEVWGQENTKEKGEGWS